VRGRLRGAEAGRPPSSSFTPLLLALLTTIIPLRTLYYYTTMGGKVQSPLSKTARCIRQVISIVVYAQFSRWLWSFQREFGFNWNTLTMIIGVFWTPLVSTPGPTTLSKSIVNISFSFVIYGIMNWIIRDYYMVIICKSFSLFSGLKCVYLIVEIASTLGVTWAKNIQRRSKFWKEMNKVMT
jgi:hypothetical protein